MIHFQGSLRLAVLLFVGTCFLASTSPAQVQPQDIKPVSVMQPMPDFTLPAFQGGEVTISKLKSMNVLLIFPRGLAGVNHWCHICNYQYADLAEFDKARQIRKTFNLEILFVLPYSRALVQQWADKFADQMQDIENWKNPPDPAKLDAAGKRRMEIIGRSMPKRYLYEKGKVPFPFPILIDAERKVSKGLGLFTKDWDGAKIEQNIPTVYMIDGAGIVRLKYISQNTFDRPSAEYLLGFLERILR